MDVRLAIVVLPDFSPPRPRVSASAVSSGWRTLLDFATGRAYTYFIQQGCEAAGKEGIMSVRADSPTSTAAGSQIADSAKVYQEGIVAGALGGGAIAAWFLILDALNGRPLYTPTVLGTALFRGGAGLDAPDTLAISVDMVVAFTWVHLLVFVVLGGIASHLVALAERQPNAGFGVILFLVVLEFGFVAVAMIGAEAVLHALALPAIFVGNLLAAAAMAAYLWRRHPNLTIAP